MYDYLRSTMDNGLAAIPPFCERGEEEWVDWLLSLLSTSEVRKSKGLNA